jgi:hypothetical protein
MKLIFNLNQFLNLKKVLSCTLGFILFLLCLHVGIIQQAIGSESNDEPHISLKVENKPLGDVLKKIALDTGFIFNLNDKWSSYPVNITIENMPLHRGLELVLRGLNHAIIYEANKSIKIVIYENVGSLKADSYPIQSFSSQVQDNQQESALSPESSPEETDDLKRAEDSAEEKTEDKSTEDEDSSDNGMEESSEETGTIAGNELDQGSSSLSENTNEQNEQNNSSEDVLPESSQEQN